MPSIYRYFDHIKFLRDDFIERQNRNPQYSLRAMAEHLKLNSGTVVRIMNGNRNISQNLMPRFVDYLGLKHKEADYFKHLILFCQAKSEKVRNDSYLVLTMLRNRQTKIIGENLHEFYEEWYFSAVRELLRIHGFNGDYRKLSRLLTPAITVHEAKRAIEILKSNGLIESSHSGYIICDHNISTGEKWQGQAIQNFQKVTIQKACEALQRFPKDERDISTMTMCFSHEGFMKVKELLKLTRNELSRIEETDSNKNRVYQINIQFFPLSDAVDEVRK